MIDNGLKTLFATFTLLRMDGKVLMMKRDKQSDDFLYGKCVAPGGKINEGESEEECAIREFFEETDLTLKKPIRCLGKVLFDNKLRNFNGKPAKFNFLVHIFEVNEYSGKLSYTKDNKGTPFWVEEEKILDLALEAGDKYLLELIDKGIKINHVIRLSDDNAVIEILPNL